MRFFVTIRSLGCGATVIGSAASGSVSWLLVLVLATRGYADPPVRIPISEDMNWGDKQTREGSAPKPSPSAAPATILKRPLPEKRKPVNVKSSASPSVATSPKKKAPKKPTSKKP
jgi:hypothetical protein